MDAVAISTEREMNIAGTRNRSAAESLRAGAVEVKRKVIVVPVSDVDRAKRFYADLGWRLDIDYRPGADLRMIQFTPPGSGCSVIFGNNVTADAPGSLQGLRLNVSDIEAARDDLLRRGIEIGEPFHDDGGVFHHAGAEARLGGPNPQRSYASYASFSDPDGNGWLLQEVTKRLTGHLESGETNFTAGLANAFESAEAGRLGRDGAKDFR
jgi:catechol 2,3-dioxygenase-like lactoylglutathione lyase family enzyme